MARSTKIALLVWGLVLAGLLFLPACEIDIFPENCASPCVVKHYSRYADGKLTHEVTYTRTTDADGTEKVTKTVKPCEGNCGAKNPSDAQFGDAPFVEFF